MTIENLPFDPEALRAKYRAERDKRLRDDGNSRVSLSTSSTTPMSLRGSPASPSPTMSMSP
jgi:hypothetical protein